MMSEAESIKRLCVTLTSGLASPAFSLSSKKLVARPVLPTLPVRPILWRRKKIICISNCFRYTPVDVLIYLLGHVVTAKRLGYCISSDTYLKISYLTTCITLGMSRPLAATAVATSIGILPVLKSSRAWMVTMSTSSLYWRAALLVCQQSFLHWNWQKRPALSRSEAGRHEYWWLGTPWCKRLRRETI